MNRRRLTFTRGAHAYMFLFSLRFTEVVWVIYLREKGFSYASIGLLETVFHIASFLSEVPTGIIADRWGRRTSVFLGRVLSAAASAIILYSRTWAFLAASFAIQAVSYTCHSGAFDALVYDSLPVDQKSTFTRLMGRLNSTYLLGTSLAGMGAAALVAIVSLDALYRASVIVDCIAALVALALPEDMGAHRATRLGMMEDLERAGSSGLAAEVKGLIQSLKQRQLRNLLLTWGVVSALGTSVVFYGQSLLKESLVPLALVPIVGTAGHLLAMLPSAWAYKVENRFGQVRAATGVSLLAPVAVLAMGFVPGKAGWLPRVAVVALYLILISLHETIYPLFSDAVNVRTGSGNRATVLSSGSMMFSVAMMVVFPLIGLVGDGAGLGLGVAAGAAIAAVCLLPLIASLWKEDTTCPPRPVPPGETPTCTP